MATTTPAFTPVPYTTYTVNSSSPGAITKTVTLPLTTVFTQPTPCIAASRFDRNVWADGFVEYGVGPVASEPGCYPPHLGSMTSEYLLYSPGVCPHLWNYAATTTAWAYQGGYTTTLAICCPPYVQAMSIVKLQLT